MLGGLGVPELLIILVVVLIIFGPKHLPQLGSSLGKTVKNIREGMASTSDTPEKTSDPEKIEAADVVDVAEEKTSSE